MRFSFLIGVALFLVPGLATAIASPKDRANAEIPSQDEQQLAYNNSHFATDLNSHLAAQPGNLFFSPYSISSAPRDRPD